TDVPVRQARQAYRGLTRSTQGEGVIGQTSEIDWEAAGRFRAGQILKRESSVSCLILRIPPFHFSSYSSLSPRLLDGLPLLGCQKLRDFLTERWWMPFTLNATLEYIVRELQRPLYARCCLCRHSRRLAPFRLATQYG